MSYLKDTIQRVGDKINNLSVQSQNFTEKFRSDWADSRGNNLANKLQEIGENTSSNLHQIVSPLNDYDGGLERVMEKAIELINQA